MRIYKRFRRGPRGAKVELPRYWIALRDWRGVVRRFPGYSDRAASSELGAKVERISNIRGAHGELPPDLTAFVEGLPSRLREKLGAWDLIDARRAAAAEPLSTLFDRYHETLKTRGNTEAHARVSTSLARRTLTEAGATYWSEIDPEPVARALAARRADGLSIAASNHALMAAKAFCKWAVEARLASENPLRGLKRGNAKTDPRRTRRVLSAKDMRALLDAAERGPVRFDLDGRTRSMAYRLALESGLRLNELRTLRVSSFDVADLARGTVTVEAAHAKNRRKDTLPLREGTALALREYLRGRGALERPFPLPKYAAEMLREDLTAAKIPHEDESGVLDFHALRHCFCSNLARAGVHPTVAQRLARHSSVTLTLDRYSHVHPEDMGRALERLPDLDQRDDALRATGTDGGSGLETHTGAHTPSGARSTLSAPTGATSAVEKRCGRGDSNPHPLRDRNLNPARLPVPPLPRGARA